MDLPSNSQPELGKLEQIVSQFLLKSLHIILDSRVPSLRPHDRSGGLSSAFHVRKSDKWFNLVLGDRPAALENLNFWHRNVMDPMIIDVILVHEGSNSPAVGKSVETVSAPVEAYPGRLCISVTYCKTLSDFNLEPSTSLLPKIITDYVGSPRTDPLRSFPSSEKGVRAISFPLRGVQAPSPAPFQRPHSWTSGFHKAAFSAQNQPIVGSPPTYRPSPMPCDYPSPPTDIHGNRVQHYRRPTHQKAISYDNYQLSPPFSPSPSPSPSPSSPSYISGDNPMQTRVRSETAPVSIPLPMTSRSFRYLSPCSSEPSRGSLPPLSPRSRKTDPSSQESPSGITSFRKIESLRSGDVTTNHYTGQKVIRDSKDDSGRFSGLLSSSGSPRIGFSRSSSRLSLQDDLDDNDFSCPFDVDDVDTSDFPVRLLFGLGKPVIPSLAYFMVKNLSNGKKEGRGKEQEGSTN
uniref:Autophagy-related protein 13 N-terminal domain-containing protein n=1 Tax=Fagus sylvatica TaxID=28930 RepID=A0A2N9HRX2_FAGSY